MTPADKLRERLKEIRESWLTDFHTGAPITSGQIEFMDTDDVLWLVEQLEAALAGPSANAQAVAVERERCASVIRRVLEELGHCSESTDPVYLSSVIQGTENMLTNFLQATAVICAPGNAAGGADAESQIA